MLLLARKGKKNAFGHVLASSKAVEQRALDLGLSGSCVLQHGKKHGHGRN